MPKFIVNKLVRDKLFDEFERMNQKVTRRPLNHEEHIHALKQKLIEEADEIANAESMSDLVSEIADLLQVVSDLKSVSGISDMQVASVQKTKLDKKGGFQEACFVETIEIAADDSWLEYYRSNPTSFPEITEESNVSSRERE